MKVRGLLLLIFVLCILVLGGFIGSLNGHQIFVNYLIAETDMRLSVLLAITFVLGALFCLIVSIPYILGLKWKNVSLSRLNKKLSQDTKPS